MDIYYANKNVEELFEDARLLVRRVGLPIAKMIKKRKDHINAFNNMLDLIKSGIDNPHPLIGNLQGCIGWTITGNIRLILDLELNEDEKYCDSLLAGREKIKIKGVVDYHGKKDEWIIS